MDSALVKGRPCIDYYVVMSNRTNRSVWLFFDLGWTLEDETEAQYDRALQTVARLAAMGVNLTAAGFLEEMVETATAGADNVYNETLRRLGVNADDARTIRDRVTWDKSKLRLYPDARVTLYQLSQVVSLGLIANQSPGAPTRLEGYGLRKYFDVLLTSAECGVSKPDSRIFEMAEEISAADPSNLWMIGDRLDNDVAPANAKNWNTIHIRRGQHRSRQPRKNLEQPHHTVDGLGEIAAIVAPPNGDTLDRHGLR